MTNNIKELRKQKHLTQTELANLCNLTDATIRRAENGQIKPSPHTVQKLCEVLCPQNPSALGLESTDDDYTEQHQLLNQYADCVPPEMIPAMHELLNNQRQNAVSYFFACLHAHLRAHPHCKDTHILMDAFAASLVTTTLSDAPNEVEKCTLALLNDLEKLTTNQVVNTDVAEQITIVRQQLAASRLAADNSKRLAAIKSIFFILYDNWYSIQQLDISYYIMSHIALLCNYSVDDYKMRTMAFSSAMNYFLA